LLSKDQVSFRSSVKNGETFDLHFYKMAQKLHGSVANPSSPKITHTHIVGVLEAGCNVYLPLMSHKQLLAVGVLAGVAD